VSLLTLGIVYGYFADARVSVRTLVALATIPMAIVANGLRVAGTGVAAHYYGKEAAEGFFHTFSGWLVFVVTFVMLLAAMQAIQRFVPAAAAPGGPAGRRTASDAPEPHLT
jgi:exosortase